MNTVNSSVGCKQLRNTTGSYSNRNSTINGRKDLPTDEIEAAKYGSKFGFVIQIRSVLNNYLAGICLFEVTVPYSQDSNDLIINYLGVWSDHSC